MNKWKCKQCMEIFDEDEIHTEIIHHETRIDPAEYSAHCPDCNSTNIEEIPVCYCDACGDVEVQHEGEYCTECLTYQAEEHADAARGH